MIWEKVILETEMGGMEGCDNKGVVYVIQGDMNIEQSVTNGVPQELCDAWRTGIPLNWIRKIQSLVNNVKVKRPVLPLKLLEEKSQKHRLRKIHAMQKKTIAHVNEPPIVLTRWYPTQQVIHSDLMIVFRGYELNGLSRECGMQLPIGTRKFRTSTGHLCILEGNMDTTMAKVTGIPLPLIKHYEKGIPKEEIKKDVQV